MTLLKNLLSVTVRLALLVAVLALLVSSLANGARSLIQASSLLNEDVNANLRVAIPPIMMCMSNNGAWVWRRDIDEETGDFFLTGFCVYPQDEGRYEPPEEETKEQSI